MAAGAWLRYPSSRALSLSPQICLRAGDTLPPEANAMPSGCGNISVRRARREYGWATAGFLCPADTTGRTKSFTVRVYSVIKIEA